jgi:hypothetical protein
MTEEEYREAVDALLRPHGGAYNRPSGGWAKGDKLYFSCVTPPVEVPIPDYLTEEQRRVIVQRLRERLGERK